MSALFGLGGLVGAVVSIVFILVKAIKKQSNKKAVIALIVCFIMFIIGLALPSNDKAEVAPAQIETSKPTDTPVPTDMPTPIEESIYFEYDEAINHYINLFNEYNPDSKIEVDDVFQYTMTNGRKLENQATVYKDGFEIVLRGKYGGKFEVLVYYLPKTYRDDDVIGQLFIQLAKPYNPALTDEELTDYWAQIIEGNQNYTSDYSFDGFECDVRSSLGSIIKTESFTLLGTVS